MITGPVQRLMTSLIAMAICGTAVAGDITGNFTLASGYLDNPLGVNTDTPAGYLSQSLRLATTLGGHVVPGQMTNHAFKVGYEGSASQFGNDTSLGNIRHGLGLEWFRTSRLGVQDPRTNSVSAGLQYSVRGYEDYYEVYDYREAYSYLAFRRYMGPKNLWSGFAAVRVRNYGELPEESSIEPHGQLKFQRFFQSRTTLGLSVRYGVKYYNDSAASVIWDTLNLPSTSQVAARLNIAQGMSNRLSLRGRVDSRWTLLDFPYYVAEDIFDSPLLDTYAHQGLDLSLALKWLAPAQVWAELGALRGEHDYGAMLFASSTDGQTRDDVVQEYYLSLERSLTGKAKGPKLVVVGGWRDQDSTVENYTYDGIFGSSSVSWRF